MYKLWRMRGNHLICHSSCSLRMWPRNCPAPLARTVPNCMSTHAFYHVFTRSANPVSESLLFKMAPKKWFAAPYVEPPLLSQRRELMWFHKMCDFGMRPKLPCVKLKSRRKLLVSVVNAVEFQRYPLYPSAVHAVCSSANHVMSITASLENQWITKFLTLKMQERGRFLRSWNTISPHHPSTAKSILTQKSSSTAPIVAL